MGGNAANAILAINSLDRYTVGQANQPLADSLVAQYSNQGQPCNSFTIQSPGALIYGYIDKIVVSQVQLQYNIPTINGNKNDTFFITQAVINQHELVTIPEGFYSPVELAAVLQSLIGQTNVGIRAQITVTFNPQDGFIFTSANAIKFYFPTLAEIETEFAQYAGLELANNVLKTYRLLGLNHINAFPHALQISQDYPNFLYTPYIDIYSDILTNYQKVKDTNTSVSKPKGLIARIYLSGTGQIVPTTLTSALGSYAFVMTADLNTPKTIRWSPDVAVPSIDFQVRDQYGDLIPTGTSGRYNTEFQMSLLCIEND